jgi:hypothetical protein
MNPVSKSPSDSLQIIVLGYIVREPLGGMVWSNLQFIIGLARLGHEVYFIEDSDDYPSGYDPVRNITFIDPAYGLRFAERVFKKNRYEQTLGILQCPHIPLVRPVFGWDSRYLYKCRSFA